ARWTPRRTFNVVGSKSPADRGPGADHSCRRTRGAVRLDLLLGEEEATQVNLFARYKVLYIYQAKLGVPHPAQPSPFRRSTSRELARHPNAPGPGARGIGSYGAIG